MIGTPEIITPAKGPKQCEGYEASVPDTSNSSLTRTCARSYKDLLEDSTRTFTRSFHKAKILTKIFMPGPPRESHEFVIKGPAWTCCCWRGSHKILATRISTRSSDKDLYKIMPELVREDFTRIFTRSCKDISGPIGGSQQDLHNFPWARTRKDPLAGFHQDLHNSVRAPLPPQQFASTE